MRGLWAAQIQTTFPLRPMPIASTASRQPCPTTSIPFRTKASSQLAPDSTAAANTFTAGTYSLFLVKLDPLGAKILYGTFLGGTQGEIQGQIALDATGNIYVSGAAYIGTAGTPAATSQYAYPTTKSAFQTVAQANAYSAFVTELAPDG